MRDARRRRQGMAGGMAETTATWPGPCRPRARPCGRMRAAGPCHSCEQNPVATDNPPFTTHIAGTQPVSIKQPPCNSVAKARPPQGATRRVDTQRPTGHRRQPGWQPKRRFPRPGRPPRCPPWLSCAGPVGLRPLRLPSAVPRCRRRRPQPGPHGCSGSWAELHIRPAQAPPRSLYLRRTPARNRHGRRGETAAQTPAGARGR